MTIKLSNQINMKQDYVVWPKIIGKTYLQSNSVITNSTGPSIFVRYNRDFVITVKVYVVK